MNDIMKTDVDEEQIAPYMEEINRQFEFIDKEDIIQKMVMVTFGRFLDYYKHAPEIEKPTGRSKEDGKGSRGERSGRGKVSGGRRNHEAEAGFKRLFINLGKADGFYPGEIMQFINKNVKGRQEVGHIDLLSKFSYIEVPEKDAERVMKALDGTTYKRREVRCNDADEKGHGRANQKSERGERSDRRDRSDKGYSKDKSSRPARKPRRKEDENGDWRALMNKSKDFKFKDETPDFSEEGWARRRPKKK